MNRPWITTALLLGGCGPCHGFAGALFIDRIGTKADVLVALEAAYQDFMAWTPSDRLCIAEIAVEREPGYPLSYSPVGDWTVAVRGNDPDPGGSLRETLCYGLDRVEDLSAREPDLFLAEDGTTPDDEARRDIFSEACASGPPQAIGWEQARSACGADVIADQDVFLFEEVYPYAPPARVDGDLSASRDDFGPAFYDIIDDDWRISKIVPAGDRLALWVRSSADDRHRWLIFDTDAGEIVWEREVEIPAGGDAEIFGGDQAVVVVSEAPRTIDWDTITWSTLSSLEPDTLAITTAATTFDDFGHPTVISDGRLYTWDESFSWTPGDDGPLLRVLDLTTGDETPVRFRETGDPYQPAHAQLVPVPGGVLVSYQEVAVDYDFFGYPYESLHRSPVLRYQASSDSWETLLEDAPITFAGTTASGYAVGTLTRGGPSDLFVAYHLDSGRLLAAADLCMDRYTPPDLAFGETVATKIIGTTDFRYYPFSFSE